MAVTDNKPNVKLPVWDVPTRAFHWILVTLVLVAWATAENSGFWFTVHLAAGYGVFAAIVFRLIWGFIGTRYALFRDFVRPWSVVQDYIKRLAALRPPHSIGHNPLGGWMVIALLVVLAAVVATGLFGGEAKPGAEQMVGPLAHLIPAEMVDELGDLHGALFNVLLVLVIIHIAGVVTDILLTRDNLIRAMIFGYKSVAPENAAEAAGPYSIVRAAIAVLVAACVVWFIASL